MLESLTPEQEAKIPEYIDKWTKVGMATAPAMDKEKADEAVRKVYDRAGLKPPKFIVHADSPWDGLFAVAALDMGKHPEEVEEKKFKKKEIPKENLRSAYGYNHLYGSHAVGMLAFYDFLKFLDPTMAEFEKLDGIEMLARHAGWTWLSDDVAVVSAKPSYCNLDESNRVHDTERAAIQYPNKWGIYAVHGTPVPKWMIEEKHKITPEKIDKESNVEMRRIMCDLFGMPRYVETVGEMINMNDYGKLYRKKNPPDEDIVVVRVKNTTPEPDGSFKEYFIRVPPTITTVDEASAWMAAVKVEENTPQAES